MIPTQDIIDGIKRRGAELIQRSTLDQEEIAKALGVSRSTIAQYSRMRTAVPLHHMEKFCQLMGTSIDYLITGRENPLIEAYGKLEGLPKEIVDRELYGEKKPDVSLMEYGQGGYQHGTLHEKDPLNPDFRKPR